MIKDSIARKAVSIPWQRFGKWRTPLLMDAVAGESWPMPHLKSLGCKYGHKHLMMLDGEYYLDHREYRRINSFFKTALMKRPLKLLNGFYGLNKKKTENYFQVIEFLKGAIPSRLTDRELYSVFRKWIDITKLPMHLNTFFIPLEYAIEENAAYLGGNAELKSILLQMIIPLDISFVIREEYDLLALAVQLKKRKIRIPAINSAAIMHQKVPDIYAKLLRHRDKYAWLAVINWWGPLFEIDDYLKRLKIMMESEPQEDMYLKKKERKEAERLLKSALKSANASSAFRRMIDLLRMLLDLKQRQWDFVSISGYIARPLLLEIAKRLKIDYDGILQLTPNEIRNCLLRGAKADSDQIDKRLDKRALIQIGSVCSVYGGKEVDKLRFKLKKSLLHETSASVLKGRVIYPGKVRGRACVIPFITEMGKMRNGDILVCPMTNPDYMPAVRIAKAIVTDEGGILCHAAIISRELKIICIVGTKTASSVIYDGDLVEVDADKGVVKILKRAKKRK